MKLVFMGSPAFAVPSLDALVEARFDIPLVVTQPDRRAGRGRRLEPTAVKTAALNHDLPVMDWGRNNTAAVTDRVLALEADAIVVAAFGHILKKPLLKGPRLGCINVHASLLPRWRGVSPIQYAVLHGDSWTGVTIMQMDSGVDTGPILSQRAVPIHPDETAGELTDHLAGQGADLLVHTLRDLEDDRIVSVSQGKEGSVYAPKLTRTLSPLRWDRPVTTVNNQILALQPYPGTTTFLGEQMLKITSARPSSYRIVDDPAGTILAASGRGIEVACGEGVLLVTGIQVPGRKSLPVDEFLRGFEIRTGQQFQS